MTSNTTFGYASPACPLPLFLSSYSHAPLSGNPGRGFKPDEVDTGTEDRTVQTEDVVPSGENGVHQGCYEPAGQIVDVQPNQVALRQAEPDSRC